MLCLWLIQRKKSIFLQVRQYTIEVGTEVKVVGRVQSRGYEKKLEDGTVLNKTAYEVSIISMEIINHDEKETENLEENQEAI